MVFVVTRRVQCVRDVFIFNIYIHLCYVNTTDIKVIERDPTPFFKQETQATRTTHHIHYHYSYYEVSWKRKGSRTL